MNGSIYLMRPRRKAEIARDALSELKRSYCKAAGHQSDLIAFQSSATFTRMNRLTGERECVASFRTQSL
jgi:hypothetical protein